MQPDLKPYVRPTIRDSVFILQAFDALGARLYGSEWRGEEYNQVKVEDHASDLASLNSARKQEAALSEKLKILQGKRQAATSEKEIDAYRLEIGEIGRDLQVIRDEIQRLSYYESDVFQNTRQSWTRRERVLGLLMEALITGELRAMKLFYAWIEPWQWKQDSGHKLILPLSWLREGYRGQKPQRSPVFFRREDFAQWLRKKTAELPDVFSSLPLEERMLIRAEQLLLDADPRPTKKKFISIFCKEFEGTSEREANEFWKIAPAEAHRAGRKSKQNSR